MKHIIVMGSMLICHLYGVVVWAAGPSTDGGGSLSAEQLQILQNKAEQVVKRCVAKAMLIREERVCESKKSAIEACMLEEAKTKDLDKAQQICERNYIL